MLGRNQGGITFWQAYLGVTVGKRHRRFLEAKGQDRPRLLPFPGQSCGQRCWDLKFVFLGDEPFVSPVRLPMPGVILASVAGRAGRLGCLALRKRPSSRIRGGLRIVVA